MSVKSCVIQHIVREVMRFYMGRNYILEHMVHFHDSWVR